MREGVSNFTLAEHLERRFWRFTQRLLVIDDTRLESKTSISNATASKPPLSELLLPVGG